MKIIIALTFLTITLSFSGNVQQNNGITVKGRILDKETGAPLENVNVFLANTTIGTATKKNGSFIISNVPFGSYNIVFSYIGYVTETRDFYSYRQETFNYNISLKPRVINLDQVNVMGNIPEDWIENLETFIRVFIGETENSNKTKILNPEVLNFVRNDKTNTLKAYSDSLIRVENKALGYVLNIVLDSLVYTSDKIKYAFYPEFKEMSPVSEEEKETWENRRRKTYLNSPRRFFYNLVHNQLGKEYCSLRKNPINYLLNGNGIKILPKALQLTSNNDSTIYTLKFTGGLEIRYYLSEPSFLNFLYPFILIDKSGNLVTFQYAVEIFGKWAEQRIADLLPKNYFFQED